MRNAVLALLLCCCVHSGFAADENNTFAIRGAGVVTCEVFIKDMVGQSNAAYMISGWLDGYVTGVNRHAPDTYDALSFETTQLVVRLVENHCKTHSADHLFAVVNALLARLHDDRIRTRSPLVRVKAGELETAIYAEVLQRAQSKLTELGLYEGDPEPEFGDRTRQALAGFQGKNNLTPTGLPDPVTLWQLLEVGRQSAGQ